MKRLCVLGSIAIDFMVEVSQPVNLKDSTIQADNFFRYYGGTGGNISYISNKLGLNVSLCTTSGNDLASKVYFRYLTEEEIDTSHSKSIVGNCSRCVIVKNEREDSKKIYFYDSFKYQNFDVDKNWLNKHDFLLCCSGNICDNIEFAKNFEGKVGFDPVACISDLDKDNLEEILSYTDILFANEGEISKLLTILSLSKVESLRDFGPNIIFVTVGSKGLYLYDNKKRHFPPILIKNKKPDFSGAGDALRSGFITALLNNHNLSESALLSSIVADFVIETQGAQNNIPSWSDVLNKFNELKN